MAHPVAAALVVAAALSAASAHGDLRESFEEFKAAYGRSYAEEEEARRFEVFTRTLEEIESQNARGRGHGAVFGINHLADLEEHERPQRGRKGFGDRRYQENPPLHENLTGTLSSSLPTKVDWREKGAVTPVKNQGQCGSCWAFSVTAEIESMYMLQGGSLQLFSMQQVVSCSLPNLYGCAGGDTIEAYDYLAKRSSTGILQEEFWPYQQSLYSLCLSSSCTASCASESTLEKAVTYKGYVGPIAKVTGFAYAVVPCFDSCDNQPMDKLAQALAEVGPVSVCLNAGNWATYISGIMTLEQGGGHAYTDLDHCVQLTGYDRTSWTLRNSWTTAWGVDGYINLERSGGKNTCGVANEATIPLIDAESLEMDAWATEHGEKIKRATVKMGVEEDEGESCDGDLTPPVLK